MASTYPTTLDSLSTTHADAISEIIHAATIDDLADAVNKIEAELGTIPKGTWSDVKTRLGALETVVTNNQTGTTYTLVLGDATKVVECNNASPVTVTVPPNSSVAFPVGTVIELWQQGAGQVSVAAGAGVTIRTPSGLKLFGQWSSGSLRKRATDEWILSGDITA